MMNYTAIPLGIGLKRINEITMNQLFKKIVLTMACGLASFGAFANPPALPEGGRLAEVHVISLDFQGQRNASMVARPCDEFVKCDNIFARIDEKTTWRDDGQLISYKQASKLNWLAAVIAVDKHSNALMVSRLITGDE